MSDNRNQASEPLWLVCLGYLAAVALNALTVFYGFFHLVLHIPLGDLIRPLVIVSAIIFSFMPARYWARKRDGSRGFEAKRMFPFAAAASLAVMAVYVHYGAAVGLIPAGEVKKLYLIILIAMPSGAYLGYRMYRRLHADDS